MANYLANPTLHIIARSIVQLLPTTAEQLFANNTDHQSIFTNATAISIGVLEAVLQSGDLDSVFITVDQASDTTPNTTGTVTTPQQAVSLRLASHFVGVG
jgi:hypothetical protein